MAVCCSSCCLGIMSSVQVEKESAEALVLDRNSAATFLVIVKSFPLNLFTPSSLTRWQPPACHTGSLGTWESEPGL